jgi:hypothetical protein
LSVILGTVPAMTDTEFLRRVRAENAAYRADPEHMARMRAYGQWLAEQAERPQDNTPAGR